jgi:hypothetical protein
MCFASVVFDTNSTEERMSALMSDAPELMSLLAELKGGLEDVRHKVRGQATHVGFRV